MGIELELHTARPPRAGRDKDRSTLLQGSYRHGGALASALARLDPDRSGPLGRVDPYNDTLVDEQQAQAALRDIDGLLEQCSGEAERAAVHDLAALLRACAATPGSHLLFIGD
ncbi:hypothetical protein [Kitasatospora sp. KL5]|uniref:hypothetical protein n=1 Tax=Kitasatospora sp. KL5 TaxID=3425125 RepID=UPI003D6E85B1